MQTRIIRIGNSRGIRIPKQVLEQTGLNGDVDVKVRNGALVIRAVRKARSGWDAAFEQMAKHGDDELLDRDALPASQWDESEWQWR